ncbi:unnamed protein product, partial [Ectocarpus sp. 12 AP-2014]
HRADLIDLLAEAVDRAGIPLHLDRQVVRVDSAVHFADGTTETADLIVGADGLHSHTRRALNGADRPFFTGQVAWRAVVPTDRPLPPEARVVMGPGRHAVIYPLRGGSMANLVAVREQTDWVADGWHQNDDPANLRKAFEEFRGPVRPLLDAVEQVGLWGLFRHPVAERWQGDGVAILGDAAHPTLPFLAQGANLALEDAWVLARCWDGTSESLAAYQAARLSRVRKVIAAANRNAWKYHVRFGPARAIGHAGLRVAGALAPEAMLRQFDWVYGHDVTA